MLDWSLLSLVACFILSNIFWAYQCHRLVNKLMSRNYFDVRLADQSVKVNDKNKRADEPRAQEFDDPGFGAVTEVLQ